MAKAGARKGAEGRGGADEVARDVGEEGVGEGVLRTVTRRRREEVDGEGAIGRGEVGTEGLVAAGGVGGSDGAGEQRGELAKGGVGGAEDGRRRQGPGGGVGEDGSKERIEGEGGKRVGKGAKEGGRGEEGGVGEVDATVRGAEEELDGGAGGGVGGGEGGGREPQALGEGIEGEAELLFLRGRLRW